MRRIKVLLLGVVLTMGGCRSFYEASDVIAAGAFFAGAVYLHHHSHHHFGDHHVGHHHSHAGHR